MNARIIASRLPDVAGTPPGQNQVLIVADGGGSGGRLSLVEIVGQRGSEPPLHRHRHEDLLVYVLDGRLTFQIDGQRFPATPGSCLLVPRDSEHGYAIESEAAHLLVILTPAGAEDGLVALHGAAPPLAGSESCADLERLVATAARAGIDITGPPLAGT